MLECSYSSIGREILPDSIAESVGSVLGSCQAATHRRLIGTEKANEYQQKYSNTDHFEMWDKTYFPMCLSRLRDLSLYQQTSEVSSYGDKHYEFIREYISETRELCGTCSSSCDIVRAVEMVNEVYMTKKDTLMHGDLHARNIMISPIKKDDISSSITTENDDSQNLSLSDTLLLSEVMLIDFEKFAYGPAGLDIGLFLCNYVYIRRSSDNKYIICDNIICELRIWYTCILGRFFNCICI